MTTATHKAHDTTPEHVLFFITEQPPKISRFHQKSLG